MQNLIKNVDDSTNDKIVLNFNVQESLKDNINKGEKIGN